MKSIQSQKGIGLIEVMVALLLLAVAVLGFSSMQMFAMKSTDESVMRTRALSVIRGGSELMRANSDAIGTFATVLNSGVATGVTKDSCLLATENATACTIEQVASRDALILKDYATENEINIRLATCPGMTGSMARQCFITSWGETLAEMSNKDKACADQKGVYRMGAQCFIMEAY